MFFLFVLCLSLCLSLSPTFFLTKQIQRNLCHVFTNYLREKKKERNNKQIVLCFNCCRKSEEKRKLQYHFTSYFSPDIYLIKNLFPLKYFFSILTWYFFFRKGFHLNLKFDINYTLFIYFLSHESSSSIISFKFQVVFYIS